MLFPKTRWTLAVPLFIVVGVAIAWLYNSLFLYKPSITLSESEIIRFSREAASGSIESANKLRGHYLIARPEPSIGFTWHEVAARNGDLDAQRSIAKEVIEYGLGSYRAKLGRTNETAELVIHGWVQEFRQHNPQ